jgi:hypothetical protein
MKKQKPAAQPQVNEPSRVRRPVPHASGDPLPTREEARRRIRSRPGFFSSMSPEARAAMLAYDGPEILGPPTETE